MKRIIRRFLCLIGRHEWDRTEDGWTSATWIACHYCLAQKKGTYREWDIMTGSYTEGK